MPHIHTEPGQHDHTASLYIIRTDFKQPMVLLHQHKLLKRWMQFGGHIELTETPWQTLQHELREETGYDMDQLKILQPKDRVKFSGSGVLHPVPLVHNTHHFVGMPTLHYHSDLSYAFVTDQEPRHSLAKGESTNLKLFTLAEVKKLDTFPDIINASTFAVNVAMKKWEAVDTKEFK